MTWTMTRFLYMPFRKLWLVTFNYTSLQGCKKNRPKKKRPGFFKKAHLRKPTKKTFYTFPLKYLLSKKWNKQDTHTVICNCFFNQTEQKVMKFKGLEKKRTNRTVWTNSNGYLLQLCTIGIFPPIFLPFLRLNFFWFCNIPTLCRCWTRGMHVNLTWNCRVCVGVGSSVCCAHAFQALPFRSELTNKLRNQRWGTLHYPHLRWHLRRDLCDMSWTVYWSN